MNLEALAGSSSGLSRERRQCPEKAVAASFEYIKCPLIVPCGTAIWISDVNRAGGRAEFRKQLKPFEERAWCHPAQVGEVAAVHCQYIVEVGDVGRGVQPP